MTIGEQIIAAIRSGTLCYIPEDPTCRYDLRWRSHAAEQLEALVQAHVEQQVRERLAAKDKDILFTERQEISAKVGTWLDTFHPDHALPRTQFNVITALNALGYLKRKPD